MTRPEPGSFGAADVAVVGIGVLFPRAGSLAEYWANLTGGVDATSEAPADRWDPVFFDPEVAGADRFPVRRGGFLGDLATFDPTAFSMMPASVEGAEPDQLVALRVAADAIADAGGDAALGDPERTGVVLGRGGYLTPGVARLDQRVRMSEQLATTLAEVLPGLPAGRIEEVRRAFVERLGPDRPESAIDLVPNLAASRIANRLDLKGPAYTVDAACASTLLALDAGVRDLRSGRCDAVIAGGVHVCHDVTLWSVFSQLGALSAGSRMRPFDRRADGILIGEGCAMFVLKRREDAERAGDRIYGVVAGVGISSDGRAVSLMRPSSPGQQLALARAWAEAGRDPVTCGMVEAHGTATRAGDAAELETLAAVFGAGESGPGWDAALRYGPGGRAVVGSVKSMIGHAMPAAGGAGLAKALLALHHGLVPPSLHCEEPDERLAATRFAVADRAVEWEPAAERRIAAVNAFGFGGINAHAVLLAHPDSVASGSRARRPAAARHAGGSPGPAGEGRVILLAGEGPDDLLAQLDGIDPADLERRDDRRAPRPAGRVRVGIVDATARKVELARRALAAGTPWRGRNDVWCVADGLVASGGKVAVVFPGVEPGPMPGYAGLAGRVGFPTVDPIGESDLEVRSREILWAGRVVDAALGAIGLRADAYAGHSLGEWSGLIATGMVPTAIVDELSNGMLPERLAVPDVAYLMVGAGVEVAQAAAEGSGAVVSHDNCVHQSVVCGTAEQLDAVSAALRAEGVMAQPLEIRSGFHSPMFRPFLRPFVEAYDRIDFQPARVPLWSATLAAPYPDDPGAIRRLCLDHLTEAVHFRLLVEAMYADGFRVFVQAGLGSVAGFVDDTLRGREFATASALSAKHGDLAAMLRCAVACWAEGAEVDLAALAAPQAGQSAVTGERGAGRPLRLGVELVRLGAAAPDLSGAIAAPGAGPGASPASVPLPEGDPVLEAFRGVMDAMADSNEAVLRAWTASGGTATRLATRAGGVGPGDTGGGLPPEPGLPAPPPEAPRVLHRVLSLQSEPFLADHCFYRQPAAWPTASDRFPVVPMTMLLEMMGDVARELFPSLVVVGLESVRALRWLAVAPPAEVTITRDALEPVERDGLRVRPVRVAIEGHASGTVLLAEGYPAPPARSTRPIRGERPTDLTAEAMYADRWMFHGPSYQGVSELCTTGEDGITGVLADLPAPGVLLDCAGQLMGLWVMRATEDDRLALPMSIRRLTYYAPFPGPAVPVDATVWINAHEERLVACDMELRVGEEVLVAIEAWEDRRFESDAAVWPILIHPERNVLSERVHVPGVTVALAREHWTNSASRDLMMRRYLGEPERPAFESKNPRAQRSHLVGRIAAKDAVRMVGWDGGEDSLHPVQVRIRNDDEGRPLAELLDDAGGPRGGPAPAVSIGHSERYGIAGVVAAGAVGVDIEAVEERDDAFHERAFTAAERALRPEGLTDAEWLTLAWCAKEAAAKAVGTGLQGRMRDFLVEDVAPGEPLAWTGATGEERTVASWVLGVRVRGGPRQRVVGFPWDDHMAAVTHRDDAVGDSETGTTQRGG